MPTSAKKKTYPAKKASQAVRPNTPEEQLLAVKKKLAVVKTLKKSLTDKEIQVARPIKAEAAGHGGGYTKWDNDWWDPTRWGDFDHRDEEHTVGPTDYIPI